MEVVRVRYPNPYPPYPERRCAIEVAVQFNPRWLKLGFRSDWQARRYADRIRGTWLHSYLRLDSRVVGSWVLIRLPSCIVEIVSSAGCPGYAGFYFRFCEPWVCRRWEESMVCFRRIRGSSTEIYVRRDISEKEIFG